MANEFQRAAYNASFVLEHLAMLDGNEHPDRNYGNLAVGLFNANEPNRIIIETSIIGTNPLPDKEAKYGALALDKLTGNFSYWQRHQSRTALSRAPCVDEEHWRFLGSALTVTDREGISRGMVTAFSGHPEGLVDEAISGVVNYSVGMASESQLIQIAEISSNNYMAPLLKLYKEPRQEL